MKCLQKTLIASAAAFGLLVAGSEASAQQQSQGQQQESLTLPTDQELIELTVRSPERIPVGQSYEYSIDVTNASNNIVLHDVKIQQQAEGLEVQSAQIDGGNQKSTQQESSTQSSEQNESASDSDSNQQGSPKQQASNQPNESGSTQRKNKNEDQKQSGRRNSQRQGNQDSAKSEWTLDQLKPGETRTITLKAVADEEGKQGICLAVSSYTPTLCLQTQFVKPEIELVKSAPKKVGICQIIHYEYEVTNTGSGNPGSFEIKDRLGSKVQTESGDDTLRFTVDGLKPGETRKFVADVVAKEPGEYSSRAVAIQSNGNETQSKKTKTRIVSPKLAVAIDGPARAYVDRPVSFTVRVTNHGNAPAEDGQLKLAFATGLEMTDSGSVESSDKKVQRDSGSGQPTPANTGDSNQQASSTQQSNSGQESDSDQNQSNNSSKQSDNSNSKDESQEDNQHEQDSAGSNMDTRSWSFGTLKPGKTKQVTVTLHGTEGGRLNLKAIATSKCGIDGETMQDLRSVSSTPLEVISLPALLVTVVDMEDPVAVGNKVEYEITVVNQGTAPDNNVNLTAKLPNGLKFVEGSGETQVESQGSNVSFGKVDRLNAGDRATWTLVAQAESAGDLRLKVDLDSEGLSSTATTVEPTQLYSTQSASG
ncbi:MAG: DUF11 domain-containing protein, partial [Planctomycetaceae bacterium]|nr:DUF11 domain-containing protein [Planctomycetaceae bacterium]